MSHSIDDYYSVYKETETKARKEHQCSACSEPISPNQVYTRVQIVFDKSAETVKRCSRCQAIHIHLREKGRGDTWPAERLDCGESYRDHWGEEPPEEIAALAFALPGEAKSH